MNKFEFVEACFNRGICRKARAVRYTQEKPSEHIYTETDIENVFSFDDIITNGNRMWADYVSGDPEHVNYEKKWAFEAEHTPIRKRKLIDDKLIYD